jgi:hypothetical protein
MEISYREIPTFKIYLKKKKKKKGFKMAGSPTKERAEEGTR